MFTDGYGNLTDDADRDCTGTMQEFGSGEDYDPMYEGPGDSVYRCGRGPFRDIPCCCDDDGKFVGPGCRHCNPPDHENKPYGFGIETFDSPEWAAARTHFERHRTLIFGVRADAHALADYGHWLRAWAIKDGWSERLLKCSDKLWDRLCETCETHQEAVAKYERWAKRVTARRAEL